MQCVPYGSLGSASTLSSVRSRLLFHRPESLVLRPVSVGVHLSLWNNTKASEGSACFTGWLLWQCRKEMLMFMHKAAKVTDDIMTCFAIGLGLPENYFKEVTNQLLDMTCSSWDSGDGTAANQLPAYHAMPHCTAGMQ